MFNPIRRLFLYFHNLKYFFMQWIRCLKWLIYALAYYFCMVLIWVRAYRWQSKKERTFLAGESIPLQRKVLILTQFLYKFAIEDDLISGFRQWVQSNITLVSGNDVAPLAYILYIPINFWNPMKICTQPIPTAKN